MSSEKATAIVLRVVEFSETSSVVTLFTREFGKIRGLAKGARRPKGPFESALDLLALCRIVFLRKSSEALDLLTEAKLQKAVPPARSRLVQSLRGLLRRRVAERADRRLRSRIPSCSTPPKRWRASPMQGRSIAACLRFELTALRLLGHLPSLEACVECGKPIDQTGRVPFSQAAGGVLCKSCRQSHKQIISANAGVLKALSRFADPDAMSWRRLEVDPRTYGELRGILNHYWAHLLGHRPRMHQYLGSVAS